MSPAKLKLIKAMQSAKYAPLGYRGMFGGRRSFGVSDYFQKANDETIVVVLIEEIEADAEPRRDLDGLTISMCSSSPPQTWRRRWGISAIQRTRRLQKVIDDAIGRIIKAGRIAGTLVNDENVERYLDLGVRFVMTGWPGWSPRGATAFLKQVAAKPTTAPR